MKIIEKNFKKEIDDNFFSSEKRFVIVDDNARKALWYKFKNGKQKLEERS